MDRLWERFWREESGTTSIEYALIAALIFLVIVGSVVALGQAVHDVLYEPVQEAFEENVG